MIERTTPSEKPSQALPESVPDPAARVTLDALVRARGLDRFAYFHVTGEGEMFPGGMESASGKVLAADGRVYRFWTAWDTEHGEPAFRIWKPMSPEPRWETSGEYRRARQALGLA